MPSVVRNACKAAWNLSRASESVETISRTYHASAVDASDLTNYSFSGVSIGNPGDRDYVLAFVFSRDTANGLSISSMTIGGVSATPILEREFDDAGNSSVVAAYYAAVPTGTTATIAVNFNQSAIRCGVEVYTVKDATSMTPHATSVHSDSNNDTGPIPLSVAAPSGNSIILGGTFGANGAFSWAGLTEDDKTTVEGSFFDISVASGAFSTSGTKTINCTTGAAGGKSGISFSLQ